MADTTAAALRAIAPPDTLPREAVELFGDEAAALFAAVSDGASGYPQPFVLALPGVAGNDQSRWGAGVLMLIEGIGDARVASIRQLVVRPSHRGRGLAARLLRAARHEATVRGATRLRSTAGWGCPDHLRMYERLGYGRVRNQLPYLVSIPLAASTT